MAVNKKKFCKLLHYFWYNPLQRKARLGQLPSFFANGSSNIFLHAMHQMTISEGVWIIQSFDPCWNACFKYCGSVICYTGRCTDANVKEVLRSTCATQNLVHEKEKKKKIWIRADELCLCLKACLLTKPALSSEKALYSPFVITVLLSFLVKPVRAFRGQYPASMS